MTEEHGTGFGGMGAGRANGVEAFARPISILLEDAEREQHTPKTASSKHAVL